MLRLGRDLDQEELARQHHARDQVIRSIAADVAAGVEAAINGRHAAAPKLDARSVEDHDITIGETSLHWEWGKWPK